MSSFKKGKKSTKNTSPRRNSVEDDSILQTSAVTGNVTKSSVASSFRTDLPESSASHEPISEPKISHEHLNDLDNNTDESVSPRAAIQGMIEVLNDKVQKQLSFFLETQISTLLTSVRQDISKDVKNRLNSMQESYDIQIAELKSKIEQQEEIIKKQERWIAQEPKIIEQVQKAQSEYLLFNVGGIEYATSLSTVKKYPNSMLGAMFSGRYQMVTDEKGRHFIDRDGQIFRHILNFLRTGTLCSIDDSNVSLLTEVLQEATYFQIEPMIALVNSMLSRAVEGSPLSNTHNKYSNIDHPSSYEVQDSLTSYRTKFRDNPIPNPHRLSKHLVTENDSSTTKPYDRMQIHKLKLKHALLAPNLHRPRLNLAGLEMKGIDLSKLDLSYTDFSRCNLSEASFEKANLVGCLFIEANLRNANFQQCYIGNTDTECPDFTDASLQGANFTRYIGVMFLNRFEGVEDDMVGLELRWLR